MKKAKPNTNKSENAAPAAAQRLRAAAPADEIGARRQYGRHHVALILACQISKTSTHASKWRLSEI
jgi:hypothetical protein